MQQSMYHKLSRRQFLSFAAASATVTALAACVPASPAAPDEAAVAEATGLTLSPLATPFCRPRCDRRRIQAAV